MAQPGSHLIEDLSTNQRENLAQLLSLPPHLDLHEKTWLSNQATLIESLPSKLLQPKSPLHRLAMLVGSSIQKAHLCHIHKPLNPFLIRRIFIQVTAECTVRLGRLLSSPSPLAPRIQQLTIRLQSLNSLWMSPEMYRVTFGVMPHEPRFERVESDCEACVLARIGGNTQIICDLRTNMLGRLKKHSPRPRLLALVEAWMEVHGRDEKERLLKKSEDLGREVRGVRSEMQMQRRRMRGDVVPKSKKLGGEYGRDSNSIALGQGDDSETIRVAYDGDERPLLERDDSNEVDEHEQDVEGSIIGYFNRRISTAASDAHTHHARDIHSAFRESVIFDAPSGTFARRPETPQNPFADPYREGLIAQPLRPNYRVPKAYTESNYSRTYDDLNTASRLDPAPFLPGTTRQDAEQQAKGYQTLVGINEAEDSIPRVSTRDERRSQAVGGSWDSQDVPVQQDSYRPEERPGTRAREQCWGGEDVPICQSSTGAQDRTSTSTNWTDFY